jgi:phosphate transport system substrate-binding protein
MAKALSKEFSPLCGNFVAEHNHTGSGDAYKRTQGSRQRFFECLDIAYASREFSSSEPAAPGTTGKMCTDAIVAVINAKNTKITNITAASLKRRLFGNDHQMERAQRSNVQRRREEDRVR